MTPEQESILRLPDGDFIFAWLHLTDGERSAIGTFGFDRYCRLVPEPGFAGTRSTKKKNNGNGHVEREAAPAVDFPSWPPSLDLERLAENVPEAPRFIIQDWLPAGYATLFAGHGGVGKSALALHMAVCLSAGIPFFGMETSRRRVLYLSCEDREAILHWRLARICAYLGLNLSSLRGWLNIIDLVGIDTVLWAHNPKAGFQATTAFYVLRDRMAEHNSQILMIDGITDTYAGNENNRAEVKQFVNAGVSIVPAIDGALVLIGHISKPSTAPGAKSEGYSGSTGWHNAARARWFLYPESDEDDSTQTASNLMMELQKSNFGRIDQTIKFSWDESAKLFIGQRPDTTFDRNHREREEQTGILRALKSCMDSSPPISVPIAKTGQRTTFHVLSIRPEFPESLRAGRAGKARFWRQIENLVQMHAFEECVIHMAGRHDLVNFRLSSIGMQMCQ